MSVKNAFIIRSVVFGLTILAFLTPLYTLGWEIQSQGSYIYPGSGNLVEIHGFGIKIYDLRYNNVTKTAYSAEVPLPPGEDDYSGSIGFAMLIAIIVQMIAMVAIYKNKNIASIIFAIIAMICSAGLMLFVSVVKDYFETGFSEQFQTYFLDGRALINSFNIPSSDGTITHANVYFTSELGFGFFLLGLIIVLNFISFFIKADNPINVTSKEPVLSQNIYVGQPQPNPQQPQQPLQPQYPQQPTPPAPQRKDVRHCPECGQARKESERFCTYCGREFKD